MSRKNTICIAGKNSIAVKALKYCLRKYSENIIFFLPNKTDKGVDNWQPSLRKFGNLNNLKEVSLNELYDIEELIFISLEFSEIINPSKFKSELLFNIHFSLLPKYRGMYTSSHPIINGEKKSGVTLHKIDSGIDTGDIIDQIEFKINLDDTAKSLYIKYLNYSYKLFTRNIENLIKNHYKTKKQSQIESSYYSKKSIDYANFKIDFNKKAFEVHNQFRALNFREYQMPVFNLWNILKTKITNEKSYGIPGEIIFENKELFKICTKDKNIFLFKDYYPLLGDSSKKNDLYKAKEALSNINDINLPNKYGCNAIIISILNYSFNCVKFLLQNGADPSSMNYQGLSALRLALKNYEHKKDDRFFKLLINYGAKKEDAFYKGEDFNENLLNDKYLNLYYFLNSKNYN